MRPQDLPKIEGVKEKSQRFKRRRSIKYSVLSARNISYIRKLTGYEWLTQKDRRIIVDSYIKFLQSKILEGNKIELPSKMGELQIFGVKPNLEKNKRGEYAHLPIDWKSTWEIWAKDEDARRNRKLVYFLNSHTDGIRYQMRLYKKTLSVSTKSIFYWNTSRSIKHQLADLIFSNNYSQFEVIQHEDKLQNEVKEYKNRMRLKKQLILKNK